VAHQCLKCGRSYPDGSPQILKGCEGCQGTRFFYTQKPISESEREELAARTEEEMAPSDPSKRERRIPTKGELPVGQERDWVSMGPGNLRTIVEDVVKRAQEKRPTFRVGSPGEGASSPPSLEEWVRERQNELEGDSQGVVHEAEGEGPVIAEDRSTETSQWPPWPQPKRPERESPVDAPAEDPPKQIVYRRPEDRSPLQPVEADALLGEPEPGSSGSQETQEAGPLVEEGKADANAGEDLVDGGQDVESAPSQGRPETVEVVEQGVYDLDVERLLEKNPIIVHKDGTYSLHLPSLMETLERKRR
jgi:uncharacterized protein